jgi:uncharacterized C2H2 Zn-finger protein
MKSKYKEVKAEWEEQREYYLYFKCPYCKSSLADYNFDSIYEGEKINRLFKCPECEKKFKLKVDEV